MLRTACRVVRGGGLIAYPTEAVYGLGCDPLNGRAVEALLALKQRQQDKGLILVGAGIDQLRPFLGVLPEQHMQAVLASWPGPVTWVMPVAPSVPYWLQGAHSTLAVRISAHPLVHDLCANCGPLVSTSANYSGQAPARSALAVRRKFGEGVDFILHGPLGGRSRPTEIRDARNGQILRPG